MAQTRTISPCTSYVPDSSSCQIHWSGITVGCTPFKLLHDSDSDFRSSIEKYTAGAAASIIEAKGCTNFGIGNIAASLCKYILSDQRTVRPVSFYQEELGVTLSMPAIIGRKGIIKPMRLDLDADEKKKLESSAKALREMQEKAQGELDKAKDEVKKE
jgi:L-lactate dehydrogenase